MPYIFLLFKYLKNNALKKDKNDVVFYECWGRKKCSKHKTLFIQVCERIIMDFLHIF